MTGSQVELQIVTTAAGLPSRDQFARWIGVALANWEAVTGIVVVRIVDEPESRELNRDFRGHDKPTNVLSFPFEPPPGVPGDAVEDHLGDLVICAPVVLNEAEQQGKTPEAHWAHLVIHGVLHLLGYDHQNDAEAAEMEDREREALHRLGYPDPYANDQDS